MYSTQKEFKMKRCPSCNLTFADTESFCPKDGTGLMNPDPAYNPQPIMAPQQQTSYPPPQGYQHDSMPAANQAQTPWQAQQAPQNPGSNRPPAQSLPTARSSTPWGIIIGVVVVCGALFVGVIVLAVVVDQMKKNSGTTRSSSAPTSSSSAPLATAIQGRWRNQYSAVFNFANGRWTSDYAGGMSGGYKIVDGQTIERDDDRTPGRPVSYKVLFSGNTMTMTDRSGLALVYSRVP
jgi:hypothetical protein